MKSKLAVNEVCTNNPMYHVSFSKATTNKTRSPSNNTQVNADIKTRLCVTQIILTGDVLSLNAKNNKPKRTVLTNNSMRKVYKAYNINPKGGHLVREDSRYKIITKIDCSVDPFPSPSVTSQY